MYYRRIPFIHSVLLFTLTNGACAAKSPLDRMYVFGDSYSDIGDRELLGEDAKPCTTPDDRFYYHSGYPSTAIHKIVGTKLAQEARALNGRSK